MSARRLLTQKSSKSSATSRLAVDSDSCIAAAMLRLDSPAARWRNVRRCRSDMRGAARARSMARWGMTMTPRAIASSAIESVSGSSQSTSDLARPARMASDPDWHDSGLSRTTNPSTACLPKVDLVSNNGTIARRGVDAPSPAPFHSDVQQGQPDRTRRDVDVNRAARNRRDRQQQKLLDAHYADAISLDLRKKEQRRIRTELRDLRGPDCLVRAPIHRHRNHPRSCSGPRRQLRRRVPPGHPTDSASVQSGAVREVPRVCRRNR